MAELIITILIFLAVIAITALLFGGWLIVVLVGAIGRLLMTPFRQRSVDMSMLIGGPSTTSPRCINDRCRAENAAVATFCRRCGSPMRVAQHVPVRRVAMW